MSARLFDLTCNHRTDPLGIDTEPSFSWKHAFGAGGQRAWRLGVASSAEALAAGRFDLWDSGHIESADSQHIRYEGAPLAPRTRYAWSVTAEGASGEQVSAQATFETGKRDERWDARWIQADHHGKPDEALDAPCMRRTFDLSQVVQQARLYICSPGTFIAAINGAAVSDDELPVPFTRYDERLLYCTYDVTSLMQQGENAIGVTLGNGWYNCFTEDPWNTRQSAWRHVPKLIAELHVTLADGSTRCVATDTKWKSGQGPIVYNGIRHGEHFDARRTMPGWDAPGFDDGDWPSAKITRSPGGRLEAMEMQPIRVTGRIEPVNRWQTPGGAWVFDTGQNMAGVVEITVDGAPGDEIVIRHAERLEEDGVEIRPGTISGFVRSGEFQTDHYIKAADGPETWRPRFVYHGFQYVEITGAREEPSMSALVLHTDMEARGTLDSSDDTINAIRHAARASTVSNLHGIPTDSPHREKNAWTGDVAVSAEQMLLNLHATPLLTKWLADLRDAQRPDGAIPCVVPSTGWGYNWGNGPDWSSALTVIPWQIHLYTGDTSILEQNYAAVARHFEYMMGMSEGGIVCYGIGDWCHPFEGPAIAVSMGSYKSPLALTDTACYFNAADTLSKMATVLGKTGDAHDYRAAADTIKRAFRAAFYDARQVRVAGDCQTSTSCMLYQGLHEPGEEDGLLGLLLEQIEAADHHQDTGILGNKYLYNVLGEAGRMDVALRMILQPDFPSYRHWMDRGATTLWECWNGEGSRNHHMFSDVVAVFYKYLAGIRPDEAAPGFRHIRMQPAIDCGLESVRARHESPFGTIASQWRRTGETTTLQIEIPGGATATLDLPAAIDVSSYPRELAAGSHRIDVESPPTR